MPDNKQRVSRHNGRAGKHGVYNPKHNDRQFDVNHADNINKSRTSLNLYWDWQETKMKQKDRELVVEWFERAVNTLKKKAKKILEKVMGALCLPAFREAAKEKIKEQAKPSIHELLRTYKQKSQETRSQKPRMHSREER